MCSQIHAQAPEVPGGASRLIVADVNLPGGTPTLVNKRVVYASKDNSCTLEAHDFYDNDTKMTVTCIITLAVTVFASWGPLAGVSRSVPEGQTKQHS